MAKVFKNVIVSTEEVFLNQLIPKEEQHNSSLLTEQESQELLQKEAYTQGYLAGKAEEKASIEQEINQLRQQLETTLSSIPQAIAQNRLELSKEIADIVLLISQEFFIEQQKDKKTLSNQIQHLLMQLNEKQQVELYLHPHEITDLHNGTIQLEASHLNGLKVKGDETLALGGYVLKTSHGIFDASIEKQIDQLKEMLLQIRQGRYHAP